MVNSSYETWNFFFIFSQFWFLWTWMVFSIDPSIALLRHLTTLNHICRIKRRSRLIADPVSSRKFHEENFSFKNVFSTTHVSSDIYVKDLIWRAKSRTKNFSTRGGRGRTLNMSFLGTYLTLFRKIPSLPPKMFSFSVLTPLSSGLEYFYKFLKSFKLFGWSYKKLELELLQLLRSRTHCTYFIRLVLKLMGHSVY